jgi:hypothetical protein
MPRVSVVIPFEDQRTELPFLEAWTCSQTAPPDLFEVIAVTGPESPVTPDAIARRLRGHDRLIREPSSLKSRLQHAGMAAAGGDIVLLTEDHVRPEPGCVAAVVAAFDAEPGLDAASLTATNLARTRFGRLEQAFDEAGGTTAPPEHWNQVRSRGFAIRREVLESIGGVRAELGEFAEPELATRIHAAAIRVVRLEHAVVAHATSPSRRSIDGAVRGFVRGEVIHLRSTDPSGNDHYFPRSPTYLRTEAMPTDAARRAAVGALAIARAHDGPVRALALREAARVLVLTPLARAASRADEITNLVAAHTRPASRAAAFAGLHGAMLRRHRIAAVLAGAAPVLPLGLGEVTDDALVRVDGYGVHGLERSADRTYRWLAPMATFRLDLPTGRHTVELVTGRMRDLDGVPIAAAVNGTPAAVGLDGGTVRIDIDGIPGNGPVELLVLTGRLRDVPPHERRRLALPLVAIRITTS